MSSTALLRMILQQGDALDRMAGLDLAEPAGVLAGAARIILVGTGTSQHAAELGAMMLAAAGREARWYPAATWVRWGTSPRLGDVLLVISHTGETAYAARGPARWRPASRWCQSPAPGARGRRRSGRSRRTSRTPTP
jgi:glucosamine--fructose-6-phosphate aminotransferase (isomerizing)